MVATPQQKERIKKALAACLSREKEVRKVVIFASFLTGAAPIDPDVAVFLDSDESCLPLAMKYRRLLRPVADQIPIDVIPARPSSAHGQSLAEIQKGHVVYERSGPDTGRSHGRYV